MKRRRKPLDIVFSDLVRTRVNFHCEHCGRVGGLHDCAHIVGCRSVATRWHPQNAVDLCRGDHLYFTEHPFEWVEWCHEKFGEKLIDEIRLVANKPVKWTQAVRRDILEEYRQELNHMQELRSSGIVSRLEFSAPDIMHVFGGGRDC